MCPGLRRGLWQMNKYAPRNKVAAAHKKWKARREAKQGLVLNLDKPRGKQVMVADISPYALQMHQPCGGRGILRGTANVPCRCATKRFLLKHPEVIIDATGHCWWPMKEKTNDGRSDSGGEGTDAAGPGTPGEGTGGGV